MSQAIRHSRRAPLSQRRLGVPLAASLVAACLVLLQLATALHFALIPHGFSAELNGFVHVHSARGAAVRDLHSAPPGTSFVRGTASCEPESCPFGFAGAHSVLLAASASSAVLESSVELRAAPSARVALTRNRVLLSAPKTSPPSV